MGTASGLLQHTDPRVTEKHYNKGASFEAARSYYYQAEYMVRTQWALSLDEKLRGDARAPSR